MLPSINKELFAIKAHYFLFNSATGPIVPFLPTIAKQLGFTGMLVGTIYTILPISGLIAKPLFGGLADKFKLHKIFFLIFQVILTVALFTIHFIPEIDKTAEIYLTCDGLIAYVQVCAKTEFSEKVMHSVITNNTHSNSFCEISCEGSRKAYSELCNSWNVTQFCGFENSTFYDRFNFTMGFDIYHDMPMNRCIYIRVKTAKFPNNVTAVRYCSDQVRTTCTATCHDNPALNEMLNEANKSPNQAGQSSTYQFQLFLWATIISWIGMAVVVSIADAICFDLLGSERRKEYGKQKLWGSLGFGIFGISAGCLVDLFSIGKIEKDYTCIFYIMLVAMILDFIISATIKKKNPECTEDNPSLLWELVSVCKESNVLVFGWWCIGAGMCTGLVWNFLFWYTEDLVTGSQVTWLKTLQGLLTGVQCFLGELPFNFISGDVIKKLGHVNVMSLVLLIYAIRFMAYSTISNPWWFLVVELLHGPTVGLCWPTMVSYGDKVTPPGTKATMQGFVGAVFEGIGVSSGSLLCGWLIDSYGGITALRVFSIGALIWLTVFWIMHLRLRKMQAFPIHQGHNHLANYANPDDAILMTASQELETYNSAIGVSVISYDEMAEIRTPIDATQRYS